MWKGNCLYNLKKKGNSLARKIGSKKRETREQKRHDAKREKQDGKDDKMDMQKGILILMLSHWWLSRKGTRCQGTGSHAQDLIYTDRGERLCTGDTASLLLYFRMRANPAAPWKRLLNCLASRPNNPPWPPFPAESCQRRSSTAVVRAGSPTAPTKPPSSTRP